MTFTGFSDIGFDDLDTVETGKDTRQKWPCGNCAGTGIWHHGRNRYGNSKCNACQGRGYFLTSPEHRARLSSNRKTREAQKRKDNVAVWSTENPALASYIEEQIVNQGSKVEFCHSLIEGIGKYGQPTEKQLAFLQRLADEANAADDKLAEFRKQHTAVVEWLENNNGNFAQSLLQSLRERGTLSEKQIDAVQAIVDRDSKRTVVDLVKINELFAHVRAKGLKKIVLRGDDIKLSPAPESGANAGCLYVKSGDGEYFGKITEDGKFFAVRGTPAEVEGKLFEIAKDPKGVAVAYGKNTGVCSCCGRELTDPESIRLGIGPICAERWF